MQINSGYNNYYNTYDLQNNDDSVKNSQTKDPTKTIQESGESAKNNDKNKEQTQTINGKELTMDEVRVVQELQDTDRKVRSHEAAHQAAGGGLAGAASFSYQRGPDNKMYAVAGEVPIAIKKGSTPQETTAIARQIQAAAMAPADPSPQDFRVAARAVQLEIEARAEIIKEQKEQDQAENKDNKISDNSSKNDLNDDFKANPLASLMQENKDFS